MILLATNKRDVTTDFVVLELKRRGAVYFRLNTEDIAGFELRMPDGDPATLTLSGTTTLDLSAVTGGYYRRPGQPDCEDPNAATAAYVSTEWSAVLRTIWNALDGRWLNCPFAILRAEDKPRQLAAARGAGFRVPETMITNVCAAAMSFIHGGATVGKPLRHALIDDGALGSVIFTNRIDDLAAEDADAVRRAPIIFQREILKKADMRVLVIDDRIFATRIGSQAHPETEVDWRRGTRLDLVHETTELSRDIQDGCRDVTRTLGLRFAAIDLVEDKAGDLWFLEANPNGQWAWIEQRTGAPVTAAIVDALSR